MFKEVTFSYNILSDPNKRCQYDTSGFEVTSEVLEDLLLPFCFKLIHSSLAIIYLSF